MTPAQDAESYRWPPLTPAEYLEDELVFCRDGVLLKDATFSRGTVRRQLHGGGAHVTRCDDCREPLDADGCLHNADRPYCSACIGNCAECRADLADDMAAEAAEEWRLQ